MFDNVYAKMRDTVEGARDVSESVWHDWPIMAVGLIMRTRGSIPEDYAEVREYDNRETKRLRREYLRRRWQDGVPQAIRWHEGQLINLQTELSRRRRELSSEEFARLVHRHKGDENFLFVLENRSPDGGD